MPSIYILPSSGISRPANKRNDVDFPQPEGPKRATNEPSSISNEMSSTPSCPFHRFATSFNTTNDFVLILFSFRQQ